MLVLKPGPTGCRAGGSIYSHVILTVLGEAMWDAAHFLWIASGRGVCVASLSGKRLDKNTRSGGLWAGEFWQIYSQSFPLSSLHVLWYSCRIKNVGRVCTFSPRWTRRMCKVTLGTLSWDICTCSAVSMTPDPETRPNDLKWTEYSLP